MNITNQLRVLALPRSSGANLPALRLPGTRYLPMAETPSHTQVLLEQWDAYMHTYRRTMEAATQAGWWGYDI
jgi:hypothetical protein